MKSNNYFNLILIVAGCSFFTEINAQEGAKQKPFKIGAVSIEAGLSTKLGSGTPYEEILSHTPSGQYLIAYDQLMKDYNWNQGYAFSMYGFNPSVHLSLHPFSKEKNAYNLNRELRVGVGFNNNTLSAYGYNKEVIGDTSVYSSIGYSESTNYMNLDASFIYKTDPERRLSFYIGYGLTAGAALNSQLSRSYYQDTTFSFVAGGSQHYYNSLKPDQSWDTYQVYSSYFVEAYIPYGVSMRLSKRVPVASNFNIFAEGKIGLNYTDYINADHRLSNTYNVAWGIRYKIGA